MQRTLPFNLNPQLSLENFIIADNQQLIDSLQSMLNQKAPALYIYGDNSSGKTHILQAITFIALEKKLNAIYLNLKTNLTNLTDAIFNADIVLLDNLDIANNKNQKIIFDIYNQSLTNFNLIITGNINPANLEILPDLKTRIQQSLSIKLQKLNDKQKIQALELRAKNKNIKITGDVFQYLSKNYSRDLKKLMQMIDILDKTSLSQKKIINKNLIKNILKSSEIII